VHDIIKGLKQTNSERFKGINDEITDAELAEELICIESFTTPGPDCIPSTILKLALNTNSKKNYSTYVGQLDPSKIAAEKDISDINFNVRDVKTRVMEYNQHFITDNPPTPMLTSIRHLLNLIYTTGMTPTAWQITEIINIPKTEKTPPNTVIIVRFHYHQPPKKY
jgi:hypothetical protein